MKELTPEAPGREGGQWPWSARLSFGGVALVIVDALLNFDLSGSLVAACLGVTLGALVGAGLDLVSVGLRRFPRKAALVFWLGALSLVGLWLARAMGAFHRLQGQYALLGWAVLGGCALAAVLGGLLLSVLQPTVTDPMGLVARLSRKWWRGLLAVLALGVIALIWVDRTFYVGLYPVAHTGLRLATLALAGVLLGLYGGWRTSKRSRGTLAVSLITVTAATFVGLHDAPKALATISSPFGLTWLDTLRTGSDFDRDGFSSLLSGGDLAPWDASVSLMTSDEVADPTLADVTLYHSPTPSPVSVVFITVDTLRADRLGAYGHTRPTSPNIDAFAAKSTLYRNAYTAGTWTSLAMSAAHRGVYPRRLRWTRLLETTKYRLLRVSEAGTLRPGEKENHWFGLPIDDPRPTLAQRLKARGMATMAVVDDAFSQFFHPKLGAASGYDVYKSVDDLPKSKQNNAGTSQLALDVLKNAPTDEPFFMWVHYFGAHRARLRKMGPSPFGKSLSRRYDHRVLDSDTNVGLLLDALESVGAERPLLVVLTSDHGETMGKRKRFHGTRITEEQVRIPLIINGPGFDASVDDRVASIVDIVPTILAATRTPVGDARFDGHDLSKPAQKKRVVFAETWRVRADMTISFDWVAAMDGEQVLAFDRRRNMRKATVQGQQGRKKAPEVDTPEHLELSLDTYLKETLRGVVDWHD